MFLNRLASAREAGIVLNPSNSRSGLHMLFLKSPWIAEKPEHFPWLPASAARQGLLPQRLCLSSAYDLTFPVTGAYFPGGSERKESACNAGDLVSIPQLGRSPGKPNGSPPQQGQRSMADCSPWCVESDVTEQRTLSLPFSRLWSAVVSQSLSLEHKASRSPWNHDREAWLSTCASQSQDPVGKIALVLKFLGTGWLRQ